MHVHTPLADGPGKPTGAARFRQAQAGDRDSPNELMAGHDGLVQAVVRRQALSDLPFAEALQAGRVGLWRTILGYASRRGTASSAWLVTAWGDPLTPYGEIGAVLGLSGERYVGCTCSGFATWPILSFCARC